MCTGENLTSGRYFTITEDRIGWGTLTFTSPTQRKDCSTDATMVVAEVIVTMTSDSATIPPVLQALAIQYAVRPKVVMIWEYAVICENGLLKLDGTPMRIGAERIRTVVQAMADTIGSCTVVTPEETSAELSVVDYKEGYSWHDNSQQWVASLLVTAIETAKGNETLVA